MSSFTAFQHRPEAFQFWLTVPVLGVSVESFSDCWKASITAPSCILRFYRSKEVGQNRVKLDCLRQKEYIEMHTGTSPVHVSLHISRPNVEPRWSPSEVCIHEDLVFSMHIFVMVNERSIDHVLVSKSGEPSETQWKTQCPGYLSLRIVCRWFVAAILELCRDG